MSNRSHRAAIFRCSDGLSVFISQSKSEVAIPLLKALNRYTVQWGLTVFYKKVFITYPDVYKISYSQEMQILLKVRHC
jgi:hypothetical protein